MSKEAEMSMMLYMGLQQQEENKLKRIENHIIEILFKNRDYIRPIWTSRSTTNGRFLQLIAQGTPQPKVLFELTDEQLASLSENEVLLQIKNKIEGTEKK